MALLAPKKCVVCDREFVAGDIVVFERKGTITLNRRRNTKYWTRPKEEKWVKVLEVFQNPSKLKNVKHERCPNG